jgi:anti-sigma factor RsiW
VTCDELQVLVHGYVDGELDLVRHLDVERHLASCPSCARACKSVQLLQATLKDEHFRFPAPSPLRRRIESSLRDLDLSRPRRRRSQDWLILAAAAAILLMIGGLLHFWPAASEDDRLVEEVVACHVRSLMANHLTDVASSDRHTVKPWFRGQLDFSPTVLDLTGQEFPLDGGRLDYLAQHKAAALVYHRRKHVINLLIWPSTGTDRGPQSLARQGYQIIHWRRAGMTYWAVSDLNSAELRTFAELWLEQTPAAAP